MTVVLVLFVGAERLVIEVAQQPGSLTPYYGAWLKGPLHATAGGKALLLSLESEQRQAMVGHGPYAPVTPNSIITWEALQQDLSLAAERGYTVSREEHRIGITNIATLLQRWNGASPGCLTVTARSQDMDDSAIAAVGEEIRRVASLLCYQAPSLEAASLYCGR
jgi:DNA-binding IclR family transcriptional regulator